MNRQTLHPSIFLFVAVILMGSAGCASSRRATNVMEAALFYPDEIGYRIGQGDDVDAIHLRTYYYGSGSQSGQVDIGQTALSVAVRHGRTEAVQELLAHGADPNLGEATVGYTPLAWASRAENMEMARALLDAGADPDLRFPTPYSEGEYPLVWAVRKNSPAMMRLLIAYGADVHVQDANGQTCLERAVEWRRDEAAQILRDAGAVPAQEPGAARPPETTAPPETPAEVFEAAGFEFHGEVAGFVPRGRPAMREGGLVVPGDFFGPKAGLGEQDAAIWRVEQEEVDVLAVPEQGAGAGQPWSGVGHMTASGWAAAYTFENGRGSDHLGAAYLLGPEGEVIPVDAPPCNQIAPCDVNEAGVVVGWYSPTRKWRGFMWSREDGFIDLGDDGADTIQAIAINNHGMMAGYCEREAGSCPRVWFALDDVIDLEGPEGFDGGSARDINDDGVVLVDLYRRVEHRRGTRFIYSPYLWSNEEGYTALPGPEGGAVTAQQMTSAGDVLMAQRVYTRPNDFTSEVVTSYLCTAGGELIRIPDYPGAAKTDCRYISESGHIAGHAVFVEGENQRYVGFVISLAEDAE